MKDLKRPLKLLDKASNGAEVSAAATDLYLTMLPKDRLKNMKKRELEDIWMSVDGVKLGFQPADSKLGELIYQKACPPVFPHVSKPRFFPGGEAKESMYFSGRQSGIFINGFCGIKADQKKINKMYERLYRYAGLSEEEIKEGEKLNKAKKGEDNAALTLWKRLVVATRKPSKAVVQGYLGGGVSPLLILSDGNRQTLVNSGLFKQIVNAIGKDYQLKIGAWDEPALFEQKGEITAFLLPVNPKMKSLPALDAGIEEQAEELAAEREEEEKARQERGFSFSEFGKSNDQPF